MGSFLLWPGTGSDLRGYPIHAVHERAAYSQWPAPGELGHQADTGATPRTEAPGPAPARRWTTVDVLALVAFMLLRLGPPLQGPLAWVVTLLTMAAILSGVPALD